MNFMQLFSQFGYDVGLEVFGFGYGRETLNSLAILGNEELGEVPKDIALFLYALADTLEHKMSGFGFDALVFLGGRLRFEVLKDRIGIGAVDVGFSHQRERHTVVETAELLDLLVAARFLVGKLVAGETKDNKALVFIFLV